MREDRNLERQNRLDEQECRELEIDGVEFASDFFDDLPSNTERLDKNRDKNSKRIK